MDYTPVTPFRRPMDAAILEHQAKAQAALPPEGVNKWEALRELGAARKAFGLTDRDLTVLQALVSFHPARILGGNDRNLVIHPSNKSICERLNGMPCSTMRRHLASLVRSGFLLRRDSPNGKRYARRYGEDKVAFGFDLSPLVRRHREVCAAAEAIRADEERLQRLRSSVSLMRRDLAGLVEYGEALNPGAGLWDQLSDLAILTARELRRNLSLEDLEGIEASLLAALDQARRTIGCSATEDMSTNDSHIEQHYQNSNKDSYDLEPSLEKAPGGEVGAPEQAPEKVEAVSRPKVPLGLVTSACGEALSFSEEPVRHWHQLVRLADILRPMIGISPSAWLDAKAVMGEEEAAIVLVSMMERLGEINSPGGYLRALTRKADMGEFSSGRMVMALVRKEAA